MHGISLAEAASMLKYGNIGVIPTDTLYGFVASALDSEAVERVYRVRGRDEGKPCIVLIGDVTDLVTFGIEIARSEIGTGTPERPQAFSVRKRGVPVPISEILGKFWPGKVSVILPCPDVRWEYLHRGTGAIAFRLPDRPGLRELLRRSGPIIAPSANPQGDRPAETIEDAENYFGDAADFFVDGGMLRGEPSTVVRFEKGKIIVVREGAVRITDV